MTALSVNLNKIALLRNSRGRDYPNVDEFGQKIIDWGADGLTIHPRPDQRHAKYEDIASLQKICEARQVELNVEGYPSEKLIQICIDQRVSQVTLVPDQPGQLTSDHGWLVSQHESLLTDIIAGLKENNIRTSLFMDTDICEIELAAKVGADRIELHTESYARAFEKKQQQQVIDRFSSASQHARDCGMKVNAGHDLDLNNLAFFLKHVLVLEVSIGHALTVESILNGLENTVKSYTQICHQ